MVLRNPSEEIRFLLTITKLYDLFIVDTQRTTERAPRRVTGRFGLWTRPPESISVRRWLLIPFRVRSGTGSRGTWHDARQSAAGAS